MKVYTGKMGQKQRIRIGSKISDSLINYGAFIQTIIDFVIIAFCVFMLVKGINKLSSIKKKEEEKKTEAAPEEPKPTNEEVLLAEIRDLLKNQAK